MMFPTGGDAVLRVRLGRCRGRAAARPYLGSDTNFRIHRRGRRLSDGPLWKLDGDSVKM